MTEKRRNNKSLSLISIKREYRIAKRKLLFASCSTFASSTLRTITVNKFRPSHSVYNSWHQRRDDGLLGWQQLWSEAKVVQEAVLIFEKKTEHLLTGGPCGNISMWQQNDNFYTVFTGNDGSILLGFRDMTRGLRTDRLRTDGPTNDCKQCISGGEAE